MIESWRGRCSNPVISCGGGKDSTALLRLSLSVDPTLTVLRADPPNGLPDRAEYIAELERATPTTTWVAVPYLWDVTSVLDGSAPYPALLKIRRLRAVTMERGFDGVALGLRAEESRQRRLHLATHGEIYRRADTGWLMCQPLARWTADEVVGYLLSSESLPINPVYTKLELAPPLNRLRDGTWYPRETPDAHGYRSWLRRHYPDVVGLYDRAVAAGALTGQDPAAGSRGIRAVG